MRVFLLLAAIGVGCNLLPGAGYYVQSVAGHLDLMHRTVPITEMLHSADTSKTLKDRLYTALRLRAFASQALALPDNASYTHYANLERKYVVWNVYAAPALSLEPRANCFPIAGCVAYRGYFAEADANAHARRLREQGYDVHISGATGYSTLQWFDDPVLNTMVRRDERFLVRLIVHELAHQKLYVPGDAPFNEAFANTVAKEGVRRWFQQVGSRPTNGEKVGERRRDFFNLVKRSQGRLNNLYSAPVSDARKRTGKAAILAELAEDYDAWKMRWGGYDGYDAWIAGVNNAKIASVATYHGLEDAFESILDSTGRDLPGFYRTVGKLAKLPADQRDICLGAAVQEGDVRPCLRHYLGRAQVPDHA